MGWIQRMNGTGDRPLRMLLDLEFGSPVDERVVPHRSPHLVFVDTPTVFDFL